MKCAICGIKVKTIEEAIDRCWIPSFYDETHNEHEPACCDCATLFLECNADEEWEVKQEYRGKLRFLDERGHKGARNDPVTQSWLREEEPAGPN